MRDRLGALAERDFRLVFASTTVSAVGDSIAAIALIFAVLHISHNSATAVGGVLACRQGAAAVITLAAGVVADRLPRHLVLVGVASVLAAVQTIVAVLVLSGRATVLVLAALAVAYGLADGFQLPASQGLIPAVVSPARLQQANALLGLSRSILSFSAPAVGGLLVAVGSPGAAIAIDAASFVAAAALLVRVRVAPRDDVVEPEPFLREFRQGWVEFKRQTWIWTTIVFFGISNFVSQSFIVLAPLVTTRHYDGATTLGWIFSFFGIGTVVGGLIALRWHPSRPLLVSCLAATPLSLGSITVAFLAPLPLILAGQFIAGVGIAIHLALWFTVFQQQVPDAARSRVSSYDALGSFVLIPVGMALAGPVAAVIGIKATLLAAAATMLTTKAIIVSQPSVRAIRSAPLAVAGE